MEKTKTSTTIVECAILIAMAFALSFIKIIYMYPKKQEKVYRGVQSYITYTVCCENERVNLKNVPR